MERPDAKGHPRVELRHARGPPVSLRQFLERGGVGFTAGCLPDLELQKVENESGRLNCAAGGRAKRVAFLALKTAKKPITP